MITYSYRPWHRDCSIKDTMKKLFTYIDENDYQESPAYGSTHNRGAQTMRIIITITAIFAIVLSMVIVGMDTINTVESTISGHMAMVNSIN